MFDVDDTVWIIAPGGSLNGKRGVVKEVKGDFAWVGFASGNGRWCPTRMLSHTPPDSITGALEGDAPTGKYPPLWDDEAFRTFDSLLEHALDDEPPAPAMKGE